MLSANTTNQLLVAQATGLAALVSDNPSLTVSARLALAAQVSAEGGGGAARSTKRQTKVLAPEDRCFARVWGSGTGKDRCNSAHILGSRYCKQHTTKSQQRVLNGTLVELGSPGYEDAEVLGARPCVLDETTHKRVGLFTGDIAEPCMAMDSEGRYVVNWNNDETKDAMEEARSGGEFAWHPWAPGHGSEAMAAKKGSKGSKAGGASKKEKSKPKDKVKQVRGKNSYLFFADSVREQIKGELSVGGEKVKQPDVAKRAGAMWKELSADEKAPFEQMAADDKIEKQAAALAAALSVEELAAFSASGAEATVNDGSAAEDVPMAVVPSPAQLVEAATAAVSVEDDGGDIFDELDPIGEDDFCDEEEPEGYTSDGGTEYMCYPDDGHGYQELVRMEDYEDESSGLEPAVVAHLYSDGRVEQVDEL